MCSRHKILVAVWTTDTRSRHLVNIRANTGYAYWIGANIKPCVALVSLSKKKQKTEWNITCFCLAVYHAIYLEELTAAELIEKIAQLFNISPRQINQIFKQGPTGIHVLVSDEVRPWFLFYRPPACLCESSRQELYRSLTCFLSALNINFVLNRWFKTSRMKYALYWTQWKVFVECGTVNFLHFYI